MKRTIGIIFILSFLLLFSPMSVSAADEEKTFSFELSVDGRDTKEVKNGDIITVVLRLKRADSSEPYTMYAMQDEIRYDSTFFEIVEGSAVLNESIVSTDIAMVDCYREFYMNYLSMSGGAQWNADMLIGSIQLRVIAESGVTQITNQDCLVSLQDGFGSYLCDANDVTIILTTDCAVRFMGNGGTEITNEIVQYGEKIVRPEDPVREGFLFEGWYADINLTDEWDFDNDVVQSNMTLYAKWTIDATTDITSDSHKKTVSCIWWILLLLLLLLLLLKRKKNKQKEEKHKENRHKEDK